MTDHDTPDTPDTPDTRDGPDAIHEPLAVGVRVRAHPGTGEETRGVVLEDFGENVGVANVIGEHRVVEPARRWAVALDTDALVFLDTEHLHPESPPITSGTDGGEQGHA